MVDLRDAFGAFRIRSIDDVQQQVCVARFLEGRTEGGHELVRQVPDETDRVGERDVESGRHPKTAHRWVERRRAGRRQTPPPRSAD